MKLKKFVWIVLALFVGPNHLSFAQLPDASVQPVLKSRYLLEADVSAVSIANVADVQSIPRVFNRPAGLNSRETSLVDEFTQRFGDQTQLGATIQVVIFDEGPIREDHVEFKSGVASRVKTAPHLVGLPFSRHATMVASLMGAQGADPQGSARGIAPRLKMQSRMFYDSAEGKELGELATLSKGLGEILISNHSYAPYAGWSQQADKHNNQLWLWWGDPARDEFESVYFGKYDKHAARLDSIIHSNPYLLSFAAAGNYRVLRPPNRSGGQVMNNGKIVYGHWVSPRGQVGGLKANSFSEMPRKYHTDDAGGLDTIAGFGLSKNALCIGAIRSAPQQRFEIASFSAFGPTDDGRVKPDLVAAGVNTKFATHETASSYNKDLDPAGTLDPTASGTSAACPNAAGMAALLTELYRSTHNREPTAAEIKALLIHSADDYPPRGPDPVYGWGKINLHRAGELVTISQQDSSSNIIIIKGMSEKGKVWDREFFSNGTDRIRATMVWMDPPGKPNSGGLDDPTPCLVNDLDIKLISPISKTVHYPWGINRNTPVIPADSTGANRVDTVEVVDVSKENLEKGTWRVWIDGRYITQGPSQDFAVVVEGLMPKDSSQMDPTAREANQYVAASEFRNSHRVDDYNRRFPKARGTDIAVGLFLDGRVRNTHQEFFDDSGNSNIRNHETARVDNLSDLATGLAGVISARGKRILGIAPNARIVSLDYFEDLSVLNENAGQFDITVHPYAEHAGWDYRFLANGPEWIWWGDPNVNESEDAKFGKYTSRHRELDILLSGNRELLAVAVAGNRRNQNPPEEKVEHLIVSENGSFEVSFKDRSPSGNRDGLDTIIGLGISKNALCVGAVEDVHWNGKPGPPEPTVFDTSTQPSITSAAFSSWGPTDDGRVKPDIVANGVSLLSASAASDESYLRTSGTSLSSAVVTGFAAALADQLRTHLGRRPTSSELKAVMIHSAFDAGETGPDPKFGWGVLDALAAGETVTQAKIETIELERNFSAEFELKVDDPPRTRVTIVWTDPAGSANRGGLNDQTPALVNDLDAVLVSPSGAEYFPWTLNQENPLRRATRSGPNRVDNVEVIDFPSEPGTWKLKVSGERIESGDSQSYTLIAL